MLTNQMKRLGFVITFVWVFIGGYYIYLQHSNQDFKHSLRNICSMNREYCADLLARSEGLFVTDWQTILFYVALGILVIWATLLAISWIRRGDTNGSK